jgi:hypothetical protein
MLFTKHVTIQMQFDMIEEHNAARPTIADGISQLYLTKCHMLLTWAIEILELPSFKRES